MKMNSSNKSDIKSLSSPEKKSLFEARTEASVKETTDTSNSAAFQTDIAENFDRAVSEVISLIDENAKSAFEKQNKVLFGDSSLMGDSNKKSSKKKISDISTDCIEPVNDLYPAYATSEIKEFVKGEAVSKKPSKEKHGRMNKLKKVQSKSDVMVKTLKTNENLQTLHDSLNIENQFQDLSNRQIYEEKTDFKDEAQNESLVKDDSEISVRNNPEELTKIIEKSYQNSNEMNRIRSDKDIHEAVLKKSKQKFVAQNSSVVEKPIEDTTVNSIVNREEFINASQECIKVLDFIKNRFSEVTGENINENLKKQGKEPDSPQSKAKSVHSKKNVAETFASSKQDANSEEANENKNELKEISSKKNLHEATEKKSKGNFKTAAKELEELQNKAESKKSKKMIGTPVKTNESDEPQNKAKLVQSDKNTSDRKSKPNLNKSQNDSGKNKHKAKALHSKKNVSEATVSENSCDLKIPQEKQDADEDKPLNNGSDQSLKSAAESQQCTERLDEEIQQMIQNEKKVTKNVSEILEETKEKIKLEAVVHYNVVADSEDTQEEETVSPSQWNESYL